MSQNQISEQKFSGWRILMGASIIYLLMVGFPNYGGVVIGPYVLKDIPMSRTVYGLSFSMMNLFVGIMAFALSAPLVNKFGIKATAIFGCVVMIVVSLLMQVVTEVWEYLVVFGVLLPIVIVSASMIPLTTLVARWFKKYRGKATGIMMMIASFGGFVAAPSLGKVLAVSDGNWRLAWLIVGGVALFSIILNWFIIKESPESVGQIPDGIPENENESISELYSQDIWTVKEALRTSSFWKLNIGAIAFFFPFFFCLAHFILHLTHLGLSPEVGSWAMGIFTIGGVIGRMISGILMDKVKANWVLAGGVLLPLIASLIAPYASTTLLAMVTAALFGAGFGWPFTALIATLANYYGHEPYPQLFGITNLVTAVFGAASGIIGGIIFDTTQSYDMAFIIIIGMCVIAVISLLFARMPIKSKA